ncbi:Bacteriophage lambda head decoration protein D [Pseudovibrio ascidiaceicola]|uniref:Bacteriophage lambda head decoration protein D n=1 Tax=Pseudovibrio ascidiaceicola TaxID=285279 RepID=A0A1I4E453_9HYPH|nr:head decoration protein [Pseudovibrio ascidiaceicola]SFK99367.1 Bacteriophage lambda head decoration protein D [Pseudovibrio ascidiaceicola]
MSTKMRQRDWSFLLSEASGNRSRETVTIAAGSGVVAAATVVGKQTDSQKYVPSPATGADGSETAKAVLANAVDATSQDVEAVVLGRDAEVKEVMLNFHSTVDDADKVAAKLAELKAVGLITR